jgi:hypothetical protein
VEEQLVNKGYRVWALGNINLLAPISIPMWKLWGNMSNKRDRLAQE